MRPDRQFPVLVEDEVVTPDCAAAAAPRLPRHILNISAIEEAVSSRTLVQALAKIEEILKIFWMTERGFFRCRFRW